MKASKFTDAQKAFIIRQGEEGTPAPFRPVQQVPRFPRSPFDPFLEALQILEQITSKRRIVDVRSF